VGNPNWARALTPRFMSRYSSLTNSTDATSRLTSHDWDDVTQQLLFAVISLPQSLRVVLRGRISHQPYEACLSALLYLVRSSFIATNKKLSFSCYVSKSFRIGAELGSIIYL